MGVDVQVWPARDYDPDAVAVAPGSTRCRRQPGRITCRRPSSHLDGRINTPASDFLRRHCAARPSQVTARRIASDPRIVAGLPVQ